MKDPQTPAEWQEMVDVADFLLHLDAARAYGLVESGLEVDAGRCERLLEMGRQLGIRPASDAVERMTNGLGFGASNDDDGRS